MNIRIIFTGGTIGSAEKDNIISTDSKAAYTLLEKYRKEVIEKLIPNVEFDTCEATMLPNEYVELTDPEDIEGFHKLMDMLNEVDDVNKIYHNVRIPSEA